jgi:hypothetical protein
LAPLAKKSVFEKKISLEGAELTVEIMIHKATKTKETEIVTVTKQAIGEFLPAYVPLAKAR